MQSPQVTRPCLLGIYVVPGSGDTAINQADEHLHPMKLMVQWIQSG